MTQENKKKRKRRKKPGKRYWRKQKGRTDTKGQGLKAMEKNTTAGDLQLIHQALSENWNVTPQTKQRLARLVIRLVQTGSSEQTRIAAANLLTRMDEANIKRMKILLEQLEKKIEQERKNNAGTDQERDQTDQEQEGLFTLFGKIVDLGSDNQSMEQSGT